MRRNLLHLLIGLLLGGIAIATMAYASAKWNDAIVFSDVRTAVTLSTHDSGTWLAVRYHLARNESCPSWSQHLIYRDNVVDGQVQRNFVPLAITANGMGSTPEVKDFALSFRLPPDLMTGAWHYVVVTSASCEWLPGLQRESVTETVPTKIVLKQQTR